MAGFPAFSVVELHYCKSPRDMSTKVAWLRHRPYILKVYPRSILKSSMQSTKREKINKLTRKSNKITYNKNNFSTIVQEAIDDMESTFIWHYTDKNGQKPRQGDHPNHSQITQFYV